MSALDRVLEMLPPPYSVEKDAVLARVLNVAALELDAAHEDLDRVRQSHWIRTAYRLADVEKLGALFGIRRLAWEGRDLFRERLLARIVAGRDGAVGPVEIRRFVYTYLTAAERTLDSTFVPGLRTLNVDEAYRAPAGRERFAPLRLIENPPVSRSSRELAERNGRVSHLARWRDTNRGLDDTFPSISVSGVAGGVAAGPVFVNTTTGDLIGYVGRLRFGQRLTLAAVPDQAGQARGTVGDRDVTAALFSTANYAMGRVFTAADVASPARVPRLARGANDWVFFLLGHYALRGLDSFGFGMPDDDMAEGLFDESRFDAALFPAGTKAQVTIRWQETEPASFVVDVPRRIVIAPAEASADGQARHAAVEEALRESLGHLHAAGVHAQVRFSPFSETQRQRDLGRLLGVRLEPERGSAGRNDTVARGGQFGQPTFGGTRFE